MVLVYALAISATSAGFSTTFVRSARLALLPAVFAVLMAGILVSGREAKDKVVFTALLVFSAMSVTAAVDAAHQRNMSAEEIEPLVTGSPELEEGSTCSSQSADGLLAS